MERLGPIHHGLPSLKKAIFRMAHACSEWMAVRSSIRLKQTSCLTFQSELIGVFLEQPRLSTTLCSTCRTSTIQDTACFLHLDDISKTGTTATEFNSISELTKQTTSWSRLCLKIFQNLKLRMFARDSYTLVTPFHSKDSTLIWTESTTMCSSHPKFR